MCAALYAIQPRSDSKFVLTAGPLSDRGGIVAGILLLATARTVAVMLPMAIGILNAPTLRAQSAAPTTPKFEVASIKRYKDQPGFMRGGGESTYGRVSTGCLPLADFRGLGLIQRAYVRFVEGHANPLRILPIEGGPA